MRQVEQIIDRKGNNVISTSKGTTVIDALKIMADKNIGSIVIKDGENYMGLLTERDYARKVILKGKSSNDTPVEEIMSTDLPAVKPSDSVEHCMQLMSNENIRYMPVFDKDQLTGIVSMSDVVKETILAQKETIDQLQNYINS